MRTLGVDVSSQDRGTAVCVARWEGGRCTLDAARGRRRRCTHRRADAERRRVGDRRALRLARAFRPGGSGVVGTADRWTQDWYDEPARRELRLRATDRWVQKKTGKWPLSVSTDSIAMCALRTVGLLRVDAGAPVDRVGGPHYEVYPGAALIRWGLRETAAGYKKAQNVRAGLVGGARAGRRLAAPHARAASDARPHRSRTRRVVVGADRPRRDVRIDRATAQG